VGYDWFRRTGIGSGAELTRVPESTRPMYFEWDPDADLVPGNHRTSLDFPDGVDVEAHTVSAHASAGLGGWGLDVLGGWSTVALDIRLDIDRSPFPAAVIRAGDEEPQGSTEARLASPVLPGLLGFGTSEVVAGLFWQERAIRDSRATLEIDLPIFVEFNARQGAPVFPPTSVPPGTKEASTVAFEQDADTIAAFGQLDWRFRPRWSLIGGLRLQREAKRAQWERTYDTPTAFAFMCCLEWDEFTARKRRSEVHASPKIALGYAPTEETRLFARWSRGFKGGGYNEFASGASDAELEYDAETADEWALDMKGDFLGGAARLDLSLFWMELRDFQVLTTPPDAVNLIAVNAAKARARGIEADLHWRPSDWLTVRGTLGMNDSEFLDFRVGTCSADREDEDGDGDPRCDHTGEPLPRAPRWTASLTPFFTWPLAAIPGLRALPPGLGATLGLTAAYQDTQFLSDTFDERARQGSFFRFRGAIGFGALDGAWSFRVVGENLTDVATANTAGQIPTGAGHFWQIPDPPRTLYGRFRWSF
jgi:iron complex outermembrane recepter protein